MGLFKKKTINEDEEMNMTIKYSNKTALKREVVIELDETVKDFVLKYDATYKKEMKTWPERIREIFSLTNVLDRQAFRLYTFCHHVLGSMGYTPFEINDMLMQSRYYPLAVVGVLDPVNRAINVYTELFTDAYVSRAIKIIDEMANCTDPNKKLSARYDTINSIVSGMYYIEERENSPK